MMERDILKENSFVKECLSCPLDLSQIWYTIDATWWHQWQRYVNYDDNDNSVIEHESPGFIGNSSLIENDSFKDSCSVVIDYEIVPEQVWKMLTENYGLLQTDTELFKRFVIKESGALRVELNRLKLSIFIYGDTDKTNVVVNEFSCVSTLVNVEKYVQIECNIPEGAVYQLIQEYDNGTLHAIHYASETTTLSEAGFRLNQNLYVDVRNSEGEFSFKDNRSSYNNSKGSVRGGSSAVAYVPQLSSSSSTGGSLFTSDDTPAESHYSPGVCGLGNLGNTCFMNSAIQCISNVPIITNYFLNDNWNQDLNKENPLGMGGRIATAYANLIQEMWSGKTAYSMPRDFKYEVAQFAPQFCGYSQHDSQELMMFLLDGLHEDLNRVTNKPYIEQKNCANQPDQIVAEDNWQYHLKRNNSIIVDYFHGQLKSRVVCPDCSFVSVTFDPFASLSLPLRHSYNQSVVYFPLDPTAPIINLTVTIYKNSTVETLREIVEKQVNFSGKNQLLITQEKRYKIQCYLKSTDNLAVIGSDDQIVMYEVAPLQPDHYYIDVAFKETNMYTHLCLPIMIQMHKKINWHRFLIAIKPHFPRFLNECIAESDLDGLFTGSGCDSIDYIDMHSGIEDSGDNNSECDRSETSSIDSTKSGHNPFENLFAVVLLETQTNSINEHEINPLSRSRLLKPDGHQHILIEWTTDGLKYARDMSESATKITCNQPLSKPTIDDCLEQFLSEEYLGHKDLWFCPKCKKDKAASKKLDIWRLPKVLVLHLKRFKATSYFGDKINSEVLFPIKDLNLTSYVPMATNDYVYDLVAVSNHVGCLAGGHYFAYAKNCHDQRWYKFDDSSTSEVDEGELVTKSAYVLVYVARSVGARVTGGDGGGGGHCSDMEIDFDAPE